MDKRIRDLTGATFGRWTVVNLNSSLSGKGAGAMWNCVCSCGTSKVVKSGSLISGSSISCGCYKTEAARVRFMKPLGVKSFNEVYRRYKSNAIRKGRDFEFDKKSFKEITQRPCHYCGCPPSKESRDRSNSGPYIYNGIDRYDNNLGYTISNSVPCCEACNRAKLMMTAKDYINLCKRVTKHNE